MYVHLVKITFKIIVLIFFMSIGIHAQGSPADKSIEVTLRMIGDQVLRNAGDSTSRVLPIKKIGDQYQVRFDAEFGFIPDSLVTTIDRIIQKTDFNYSYILSVEECVSGDVVYSYEIDLLNNSDVGHCRAREVPLGCYSLLFTMTETKSDVANLTTETAQINYGLIALFLTLILGAIWFLLKLRYQDPIDPNIIILGDYRFDKRNTELYFNQQKIELTSKEADLLLLLHGAINTTIEREVILNRVWGDAGDYVGRTLDVFISKLRKKLDADPKVKIVNIRGVGYKLVVGA